MKESKKSTIIAIVIFLIIFSLTSFLILRVVKKDNPNQYTYNNFRVFKNPNIVGYTIIGYRGDQPYHFKIRNDPRNTENITLSPEIRNLILQKPTVYFTMNPNLTSKSVIAALEISQIISRSLGIYNKETIGAITSPVENNPTIVITCDNVTKTENVILFKIGDETKVYLENNCIIVQGTDEWEIIRAADRLAYHILEVIP